MAPKACAPNSAISSRVISWLSLPSSVGCAMQAAVQPTPTAASVLTIRHRPPSAGTRLCTGVCGSCCSCGRKRSSSCSSGAIKLPSAAVSTKPSVDATIKAKRIISQSPIFARMLFSGIFLLCVENFQCLFQRHAAAGFHQQGVTGLGALGLFAIGHQTV